METNRAFTQPTTHSISLRLRLLRKSRGWTLHDVEKVSNGSIKAVVMGSYERGSRAISLARCLELAELFSIPITELLIEPSSMKSDHQFSKRFDLRRSSTLCRDENSPQFVTLHKFLIAIAARRGDWNGEILTLRESDLDTITLLIEMNQQDLNDWLVQWRLTLS